MPARHKWETGSLNWSQFMPQISWIHCDCLLFRENSNTMPIVINGPFAAAIFWTIAWTLTIAWTISYVHTCTSVPSLFKHKLHQNHARMGTQPNSWENSGVNTPIHYHASHNYDNGTRKQFTPNKSQVWMHHKTHENSERTSEIPDTFEVLQKNGK